MAMLGGAIFLTLFKLLGKFLLGICLFVWACVFFNDTTHTIKRQRGLVRYVPQMIQQTF